MATQGGRVLKVTHQGQHRTEAESNVDDCLVVSAITGWTATQRNVRQRYKIGLLMPPFVQLTTSSCKSLVTH